MESNPFTNVFVCTNSRKSHLVPEAGAWPIPTREEGNLHPRTTPVEEHGGMGAPPKGVKFLCTVAASVEWI
jgi:hypothetical protein